MGIYSVTAMEAGKLTSRSQRAVFLLEALGKDVFQAPGPLLVVPWLVAA